MELALRLELAKAHRPPKAPMARTRRGAEANGFLRGQLLLVDLGLTVGYLAQSLPSGTPAKRRR